MEKGEFKIWAEGAVTARDAAIEQIDAAADVVIKTFIVGQLKEKLNGR